MSGAVPCHRSCLLSGKMEHSQGGAVKNLGWAGEVGDIVPNKVVRESFLEEA